MTLAARIGAFVHDLTWASLDAQVRDSAQNRLLDALSTAVASQPMPVAQSALAVRTMLGHLDGPATVLATGAAATPDTAAFVNGVGVHAVLFEDINLESADHPGAVIVPAALAAAESAVSLGRPAATMEDLLLAVLAGYEVHLRLGKLAAAGIYGRGLRTTSVLGSVGAAAAAAKALSFDLDETVAAIAFGGNAAFGFLEGFAHGTSEPYLQAGFAARTGVLAALTAFAGAPITDAALDGPAGYLHALAGVDGVGADDFPGDWLIGGVSAKPYPISGGKISIADSARAVAFSRAPRLDEIVRLTAFVGDDIKAFPGADLPGPYTTLYQAQDSVQFCAAAGLLGRPMDSLAWMMSSFDDPEVSELTARTEVVGEPGRRLSAVRVELVDGTVIDSEVDWSDRQVPTTETMARKLADLTESYWRPGTAASVAALVAADDPTRAVAELTALLRDARR